MVPTFQCLQLLKDRKLVQTTAKRHCLWYRRSFRLEFHEELEQLKDSSFSSPLPWSGRGTSILQSNLSSDNASLCQGSNVSQHSRLAAAHKIQRFKSLAIAQDGCDILVSSGAHAEADVFDALRQVFEQDFGDILINDRFAGQHFRVSQIVGN
ncbi:MAG: hypothetical protein BYD32DRAFT_456583 [Podila humilis]|nr:MAG: hypothetical protein BYD32DRAFT_456583 [Podila humilis]